MDGRWSAKRRRSRRRLRLLRGWLRWHCRGSGCEEFRLVTSAASPAPPSPPPSVPESPDAPLFHKSSWRQSSTTEGPSILKPTVHNEHNCSAHSFSFSNLHSSTRSRTQGQVQLAVILKTVICCFSLYWDISFAVGTPEGFCVSVIWSRRPNPKDDGLSSRRFNFI